MHIMVGLRLHGHKCVRGASRDTLLVIALGSLHDKISSSRQHSSQAHGSKGAPATNCARRMGPSRQVFVGACRIRHFISCDGWLFQCVPGLGRGAPLLHAGRTWRCSVPRRPKEILSSCTSRERSGSSDELSQVIFLLEWSARRHDLLFWLSGGRTLVERALANRSATESNSRRGALPHRNAQCGPLERASGHGHTDRRRPCRSVPFREKSRGLVGE